MLLPSRDRGHVEVSNSKSNRKKWSSAQPSLQILASDLNDVKQLHSIFLKIHSLEIDLSAIIKGERSW